jgi:hypothetical protein
VGLADYKVHLKLPPQFIEPQSTYRGRVEIKGVGPSTTLAWPGWKQPDIPVKMTDTTRNKPVQERLCKMCIKYNCTTLVLNSRELLMFTEPG